MIQSPSESPLPYSVFAAEQAAPGDQWDAWRDSVSVIFDVSLPDDSPHRPVAASVHAYHLGGLVFGDTRFTAQSYRRPQRKIARDGIDHYMLQLYLDGGFTGSLGEKEVALRPGDLCLLDLAKPLDTRTSVSRTYSLVIPRDLLDAALPDADILHGMVLRRESGLGMMLADHVRSLWRSLPVLTIAEAPAATQALLGMVSACYRPTAEALECARGPLSDALLAQAKRQIEAELSSPDLSPDKVAAACRVSRATLYRLFEQEGGIAAFILARRLERAHAALRHPGQSHRRIYDIAFDCGFSSEAHFSRAFRRAFGLSPGQARAEAVRPFDDLPAIAAQGAAEPRDYAYWLAHLGQAKRGARPPADQEPSSM